MTDRTTLNVDGGEHKAARDVKDEHGDSWTDVLRFYREHRPQVSLNGDTPTPDIDTDAIADSVADVLDTDTEVDISTDKLAEQIADRVAQHTTRDTEAMAREVARQLDYAELASQVGSELEGRMR
jgi:hypothetical protein